MLCEDHVAVVHWPSDIDLLDRLREQGVPRLLIVTAGAPAPRCTAPEEDWVRLPASDEDVRARARSLLRPATEPVARTRLRPTVVGDGRIVYGVSWEPLSELEEVLVRQLADRFGEVVSNEALATSCPGREMSMNAVRVHLTRLRKRISGLGLAVRTVRGRGYVMEACLNAGAGSSGPMTRHRSS